MTVDQIAPHVRAAWTAAWVASWHARIAHTQINPNAPRASAVGWYYHIRSPWKLLADWT